MYVSPYEPLPGSYWKVRIASITGNEDHSGDNFQNNVTGINKELIVHVIFTPKIQPAAELKFWQTRKNTRTDNIPFTGINSFSKTCEACKLSKTPTHFKEYQQ